MQYLEWNNCLGDYFFNEGNRDKAITLVVSTEDIVTIGKKSSCFNGDFSEEDIVKDFKAAWRGAYPGVGGNIIEKIKKENDKGMPFYKRGIHSFNCGDITVRFPPPLAHLIGINLALLEDNNDSNYQRVRSFFAISDNDFPHMNPNLNWNQTWGDLTWWVNTFKDKSLGILPERSLTSQKYRYIGRPYTLILLSKVELRKFYKFLFDNEILPNESISNAILINAYQAVCSNKEVIGILKSGKEEDVEDQEIILAILKELYNVWDGHSEEDELRIRTLSQLRRLRLCFNIDASDGYAKLHLRFYEDKFLNSDIIFKNERIVIHPNGWSSPLTIRGTSITKTLYEDPTIGLKALFRPSEDFIFVFLNGRTQGLNSSVFIETDQINYDVTQYLLVKKEVYPALADWIVQNGGHDKSVDMLDKFQSSAWNMFYFPVGFRSSHPGTIEKLKLPSQRALVFIGGLRGDSAGEWINKFPITLVLNGAKGNERLSFISSNTESDYPFEEGLYSISNQFDNGTYTIKVISYDGEQTSIPSNGRISLISIPLIDLQSDKIAVKKPSEHVNSFIDGLFKQLGNVVRNIQIDTSPPQFNLWEKDELTPATLSSYNRFALHFLKYLGYRGKISPMVFDQSLACFYSNLNPSTEFQKLGRFTLGRLTEGSRIVVEKNKDGLVNAVIPIKPFLFKLPNAQNISIEGVKAMKPFSGSLFGLGGIYSFEILENIRSIVERNAAVLKIYGEGSDDTLVPPSVFIYEPNGVPLVKPLLEFLGQDTILPSVDYLTVTPNLKDVRQRYLETPQLDLHKEDRYQPFDIHTLSFVKFPQSKTKNYPSLALYEINPWEKYFILRFHLGGKEVNVSVEPRWGKYLLLNELKILNLIFYDPSKNVMIVPASIPFPEDIERNLFFITGRLPLRIRLYKKDSYFKVASPNSDGKYYIIYRGILRQIAEDITMNVGQNIINTTIETT